MRILSGRIGLVLSFGCLCMLPMPVIGSDEPMANFPPRAPNVNTESLESAVRFSEQIEAQLGDKSLSPANRAELQQQLDSFALVIELPTEPAVGEILPTRGDTNSPREDVYYLMGSPEAIDRTREQHVEQEYRRFAVSENRRIIYSARGGLAKNPSVYLPVSGKGLRDTVRRVADAVPHAIQITAKFPEYRLAQEGHETTLPGGEPRSPIFPAWITVHDQDASSELMIQELDGIGSTESTNDGMLVLCWDQRAFDRLKDRSIRVQSISDTSNHPASQAKEFRIWITKNIGIKEILSQLPRTAILVSVDESAVVIRATTTEVDLARKAGLYPYPMTK